MRFSESDIQYCGDESVIALVDGHALLSDLYGRWPTFTDSEIIECHFLRGNLLQCMRNKEWANQSPPSLRCVLYCFDERYADDDPRKNPALVRLLFSNINEFYMDGFNYQNAICGMGISRFFSSTMKTDMFKVAWGGAAIQHDVIFTCDHIVVESVTRM